jgi:hypothetical protein
MRRRDMSATRGPTRTLGVERRIVASANQLNDRVRAMVAEVRAHMFDKRPRDDRGSGVVSVRAGMP